MTTLTEGCKRLTESEKRFEDIYNIVFSYSGVFSRTYQDGKVSELTYRRAKEKIESLSGALYKRVGSGSFVGLYGVNSEKWLLLFWAILKSGNKPYLINLHQPEAQIRSCLSTLRVSQVIFTEEEKELGGGIVSYDELSFENEPLPKEVSFENELAITTSGTSLQEKICVFSGLEISAQILNSLEAVGRNRRIIKSYKGEIRMLMLLPLYHIFGLVASYLWFLFTGAVFCFSGKKGSSALLETAKTLRVTHIFSVPLLWHTLEKKITENLSERSAFLRGYFRACFKISLFFQNIFPRLGLLFPKIFLSPIRNATLGRGVRFCISGGSALKPSAMRQICALGFPLFSGYGSTEIGIASVDFSKRPKNRAFPCAGVPFSSVEFEIRANGRLFVKGRSVCKKQIIDGVFTATESSFDTGDVAFKDEKGKYHIAGRDSDVVISDNGENLNPDLAEKAFALSGAVNFAVLGDEKNERLILIVQTAKMPLGEEVTTLKKELLRGLERLPRSYRIKEIFITADPLIPKGEIKVSRTALRNRIKDQKISLFTFDING